MPLDKSGSKNSVSKNIKKELSAGKPLKQAQAIALNVKKSSQPKIKENKPAPMLDNRAGRLSDVKTDRGIFRIKSNRKGD